MSEQAIWVYLGLGSNLGDRERNLREAIHHLRRVVHVSAVSDLYETEPVGIKAQPWFLNAVLAATTRLAPMELLRACQAIERRLGRPDTSRSGPRTIDIDLLLYDDLVLDSAALTLPHPRLHERRFVLEPLAELAPELRHPRLKRTVRELLAAGGFEQVRRVGWSQAPLAEQATTQNR